MTDWLKIADGKANGLTSDGSAISLRWRDHGDLRGSLYVRGPGRFAASIPSEPGKRLSRPARGGYLPGRSP